MSADESWSSDPRLDPYRDAVWELRIEGRAQAHLLTRVTYDRSSPFRGDVEERMSCKVCWLDGRQDRPEEDYGPEWFTVAELERGRFESGSRPGLVFDAGRVTGGRRDEVWQRFGPP
jgi:hypothetical protein